MHPLAPTVWLVYILLSFRDMLTSFTFSLTGVELMSSIAVGWSAEAPVSRDGIAELFFFSSDVSMSIEDNLFPIPYACGVIKARARLYNRCC